MIEFKNVSRWYGQVIGVNDINTQIGAGITALLGQNGAGKTTLIRLIVGQLKTTTGSVSVLGNQPFANVNVAREIGYCPEIDSFPEHLSGRAFVERMGMMSGLTKKGAKDRTEEMMVLVGMADRCDKKIKGYSKGMRQRIKLAQAMIHDPQILLLDEPLNGLDPLGRRHIMNLLEQLAAAGKAVIVSSHILFEVEQMTRSILVLHNGRLLAAGDLRVIRDLIDQHPHRIKVNTPDPRKLAAALMQLPYIMSIDVDEVSEALELRTKEPTRFYDEFSEIVLKENLSLYGMQSPDNNLESVFQYLIGVE